MEQYKLEHPDSRAKEPRPKRQRPEAAPRFKYIDRDQSGWRDFALDDLIDQDHPARAIWEFLVEEVDLTPFWVGVCSVEGWAGQAGFPPELLIALWLYAYSEGIGSAREIARLCGSDPAFRWLCGDHTVNYHTLSDFRVQHGEALRELMVSSLAAFQCAGLVKLECVAHDGTKVRAVASNSSLHRQGTIEQHLAVAQERMREMEEEVPGVQERQQAARRRAAEERRQRLQQAADQLKEIQEQQEEPSSESSQAAEEGKAKAQPRVSETEPEARRMKLKEGYYAPAYNVQMTTDCTAGIIINAEVSTIASDFPLLTPALEQVKETFGKMPDRTLADGGYLSRKTIAELDGRTDLMGHYDQNGCYSEAQRKRRQIAPEFAAQFFIYDEAQNRFLCPAEKPLTEKRKRDRETHTEYYYQASGEDCGACPHKEQCCPTTKMRSVTRVEEDEGIERFRKKMESEEAQEAYKERSQVAEFVFCWIKEKMELRRFHVRGLEKVRLETLWVALAYNVKQWIRIRKQRAVEMAA